jgi:Tfp pilus assembly protein PilZ
MQTEVNMQSNAENRDNTRFPHEAEVTLETSEIGVLYGARMHNFSDTGLYFESDYLIQPGSELIVGIKDSPYSPEPGVYQCFRAEIKWRKSLKTSAYYYGYGARFLDMQPVNKNDEYTHTESRKHPRKRCSISVKFDFQDETCRGAIKNISSGGIFLQTTKSIAAGQRLDLIIPVRNRKAVIRRGSVVWTGGTGVGIKLQRSKKT